MFLESSGLVVPNVTLSYHSFGPVSTPFYKNICPIFSAVLYWAKRIIEQRNGVPMHLVSPKTVRSERPGSSSSPPSSWRWTASAAAAKQRWPHSWRSAFPRASPSTPTTFISRRPSGYRLGAHSLRQYAPPSGCGPRPSRPHGPGGPCVTRPTPAGGCLSAARVLQACAAGHRRGQLQPSPPALRPTMI